MHNQISHETACKSAAVKVQYWLGKEKDALMGKEYFIQKPKDFFKTYKCDLVKTPRIPTQVEHIPLYGYNVSKKKKQSKPRHITKEGKTSSFKIDLDSTSCSVNQKYPHYLSSDRVINWHLKEHFFVCKRLKLLAKQLHPGPKRHDVVLIHSSEKGMNPMEETYIEEWKRIQKDRQFPVSHITT